MTKPVASYANVAAAADAAANDVRTLLRHIADQVQRGVTIYSRTMQEAGTLFACGAATLLLGAILLCFAAAHLIVVLIPGMSLWVAYGLIGSPVFVLGGIILRGASQKLHALDPVQSRSAQIFDEANNVAGHIGDVVETAKRAAQETVDSVKDSVDSVKQSVDVNYQMQQRPWTMIAGATMVGYASGTLLNGMTSPARRDRHVSAPNLSGGWQPEAMGASAPGSDRQAASTSEQAPGLLHKIGEALAPEAAILRELAIGMLFGVLRDAVRGAIPGNVEMPIDEMFNNATRRFGGRPVAPTTAPGGARPSVAPPGL